MKQKVIIFSSLICIFFLSSIVVMQWIAYKELDVELTNGFIQIEDKVKEINILKEDNENIMEQLDKEKKESLADQSQITELNKLVSSLKEEIKIVEEERHNLLDENKVLYNGLYEERSPSMNSQQYDTYFNGYQINIGDRVNQFIAISIERNQMKLFVEFEGEVEVSGNYVYFPPGDLYDFPIVELTLDDSSRMTIPCEDTNSYKSGIRLGLNDEQLEQFRGTGIGKGQTKIRIKDFIYRRADSCAGVNGASVIEIIEIIESDD